MKKHRIISLILFFAVCIAVICRIYYVNANARLPKVIRIEQGDTEVFKGVAYTVVGATLWEPEEFNEYCYGDDVPEYVSLSQSERKVLVVEFKIEKAEEKNVVEGSIPLYIYHTFNYCEIVAQQILNPIYIEEGISTDRLYMPYNICRENITKEQWEQVVNLETEYKAVLGVYPEKREFIISDVKEGKLQ